MGQAREKQKGFTLIELLIVVVVIGILAAIAIPSYQNYVRKARRADGQAALLALAMAQEKFRVNCAVYAKALSNSDSCTDTNSDGVITSADNTTLKFSGMSPDMYYTIGLSGTIDAINYAAQATPTNKGGQNADTACTGATFQITQNGPDKSTAAKKTCWGVR